MSLLFLKAVRNSIEFIELYRLIGLGKYSVGMWYRLFVSKSDNRESKAIRNVLVVTQLFIQLGFAMGTNFRRTMLVISFRHMLVIPVMCATFPLVPGSYLCLWEKEIGG